MFTLPKTNIASEKWMVGILCSFWYGEFSGGMLVSGLCFKCANIDTIIEGAMHFYHFFGIHIGGILYCYPSDTSYIV